MDCDDANLDHPVSAVPPDSTRNDFGNVCVGPGGGKTLGFWSNKNGEKVIDANGGLAIVNLLPLVNGARPYVPDFPTHGAFSRGSSAPTRPTWPTCCRPSWRR